MKIQGVNTVTLFNDFDETRKAITRALHEKIEDKESYEKALLTKAAASFNEADGMNVVPNIEDYAYIMFRHLSKAIVGGSSYKASDFSKGNVLKDSTQLLNGVNAYTNHFAYVGNQIGKVLNPEWSNGYKNDKGETVPPGINAPFVIDKILHPKLVRELNSLVGSPIDSASVTVIFEWEASHDFERDYDFYYHLGEEVDGSMVRRISTSIKEYEESSLVWSGADPYAKILHKPGSLESESLSKSNKFSANPELALYDTGRKYYVFDSQNKDKISKFNKVELSFNSDNKTKTSDIMKDKFLKLVADAVGCKVEELNDSHIDAVIVLKADDHSKLKGNSENFEKVNGEKATLESDKAKLEKEKSTLEDEKVKLEATVAELKPAAELGKESLTKARQRAVEMYEKFAGDKVDKTIKGELEAATDIASLEAKVKLFGGQLYEKFSATCKKCGTGEHVELRSSFDDSDSGDTQETEEHIPMWKAARGL